MLHIRWKRFLCGLLAMVMAATTVPVQAIAAAAGDGGESDNLEWKTVPSTISLRQDAAEVGDLTYVLAVPSTLIQTDEKNNDVGKAISFTLNLPQGLMLPAYEGKGEPSLDGKSLAFNYTDLEGEKQALITLKVEGVTRLHLCPRTKQIRTLHPLRTSRTPNRPKQAARTSPTWLFRLL